jgi:chromosome segregation ATPase
MLSTDILISFAFMALLFLRHVAILKRPNKINYAPLMLGIGGIATLIHFIVYSHATEITPLLKESLFPFLVALLFYMVMNVLNQTKESDEAKQRERFLSLLVQELSELKSFMLELEHRMLEFSQENISRQEELREAFKKDVEALSLILKNQKEFTKRFEMLEQWHNDVKEAFEHFSKVQLPELDAMVHKHIDVLRVAEQEHYNKLSHLLRDTMDTRGNLLQEVQSAQEQMQGLETRVESIGESIVKTVKEHFSHLTKEFEGEMVSLKLHAEGVKTTLYEDEALLGNIRSESEMIVKQMVLSSKQMQELEKYFSSIYSLVSKLQLIVDEINVLQRDYSQEKTELSKLLELEKNEKRAYTQQIEMIEKKLDSLQKQHQTASEQIQEQTKFLARRAKVQQSYGEVDDFKGTV